MAALPAFPTPAPSPRVVPSSGQLNNIPPPAAAIGMDSVEAAHNHHVQNNSRNGDGNPHTNNNEDMDSSISGQVHVPAHVLRLSRHNHARAHSLTLSNNHNIGPSDVLNVATSSASIPSIASLSPVDITLPHPYCPAGHPTCRVNPVPLLTPELELELGTATGLGRCTCADSDSNDSNRATCPCQKSEMPHATESAAILADNNAALLSMESSFSSGVSTPTLTGTSPSSAASMSPYRHAPSSTRRSQPGPPSPLPTAPLLLLRRRSRAPLYTGDNDAPTTLSIPSVTLIPGVTHLTGPADKYTGPAPGFSFGTCPSEPDVLSPESASGRSMTFSPGPISPGWGFHGLERRATPTAELGPFEYPAVLDERKGSTASTSSHTSHISHTSLLGDVSGLLQSPVKVAPPLPLKSSPSAVAATTLPQSISTDRYMPISLPSRLGEPHSANPGQWHFDMPSLGRRGSIALGQIPRLARTVPGRPTRGHTSTGSLTLSTGNGGVGFVAAPRLGSSPGSTVPSMVHAEGQRSSSAGNLPPSTSPGSTPMESPALCPSTSPMAGPIYLLPRTHGGAGPIAFAHSALPAPIPPSLLARRGSVPANLIWGLQGDYTQGVQPSPTASTHSPSATYRVPLPSPSAVPKLFLPPRRFPHSRPRRWSKEATEKPDMTLVERVTLERTSTTGLIGLADRSRPISSSADRSRPASMHMTPIANPDLLLPSSTSSSSASPGSTTSSFDRPPLSTANSDVTVIDALMDDERADQVESLEDDENDDEVENEAYPDGRGQMSSSPMSSPPSKFTFPSCVRERSSDDMLAHEFDPTQSANLSRELSRGEHGMHSGHASGIGHEAHFPDPCVNGQTHYGRQPHSPLVAQFSTGGSIQERRRYAPLSSYPLSTVPSSDGTDEGRE